MLIALAASAFLVLMAGWARPASWALVLAVTVILAATWLFLFVRRVRE